MFIAPRKLSLILLPLLMISSISEIKAQSETINGQASDVNSIDQLQYLAELFLGRYNLILLSDGRQQLFFSLKLI